MHLFIYFLKTFAYFLLIFLFHVLSTIFLSLIFFLRIYRYSVREYNFRGYKEDLFQRKDCTITEIHCSHTARYYIRRYRYGRWKDLKVQGTNKAINPRIT